MEVAKLLSGLGFNVTFGLSFPWIPHGNLKKVCWHRTPKSSEIDLWYETKDRTAWEIPKSRTAAAEKAAHVSTLVCETCESWFARMADKQSILDELEIRRASRDFYNYVQGLTVYLFWRARIGKWNGLDTMAEDQLKKYFGEEGFPERKQLLENEAHKAG